MVVGSTLSATEKGTGSLLKKFREQFAQVPLLGWLFGVLIAVAVEYLVGKSLARWLGLGSIPPLFGVGIIFKQPSLIPSAMLYVLLVYLLPAGAAARLSALLANKVAAKLLSLPLWLSAVSHLALLYIALHMWASLSDYRVLVLRFILIAIMLTLSLNVVNGYMGEFSCSHPGFMALGAYAASVFTVMAFVHDDVFGPPLLPPALGPFMFPLALIIGGLVAALGALVVAIPSFRTRGDYLAIISLAFMFIVKSFIENLEVIGGPRGFMNQPKWANLPTVFAWTVVCVAIIHNFVRSTLGKAMCAVRDDETAADAMTVNTRRTKMVTFLFAAFWAGVAGGLFAHVIGYINPGTFGVLKLSEVLAMVYFGGLNSVVGSVVGAISLQLLMEALRPLEILKWIAIATLLILVMIFRPTGLIAFREMNIEDLIKPRQKPVEEVKHGVAQD